jgi:Do/DeqQ family serine protease
MKKLMQGFLMAVMGGAATLGMYKYFEPETAIKATQTDPQTNKLVNLLTTEPENAIDYVTAAEMTVNGVVHVKVEGMVEYSQRAFDPIREFLYGNGNIERNFQQPVKGAGSGVIISEDGYVVTNNHVIEHANQITVTMNNKKNYTAKLIGTDPNTDLAVLKIEEEGLPHLVFGNSDDLHIGEWVLAVGNPFNLTSTVTAGIVSAKGRDINILGDNPYSNISSIESFIQTDAAVNPGNSGGALVNTSGELIGINTAIKSNTGSYAGYSFAIPANIVRKVVSDIIEFGNVQRAFIGINIRDIDQKLAEELEIDDLSGVYVSGLSENGSAKEAGIKDGDIVKKINGNRIRNVTELQAKIGEYRPGDEVDVTVERKGELLTKKVVLRNIEGSTTVMVDEHLDLIKALGANFSNLQEEELEELKLEGGVKITQLFPGKLMNSGMREGFIITKVGESQVRNKAELLDLLEDKQGGILVQGLYKNGREAYYGFGL